MRHNVQENITNPIHHSIMLLPFRQRVPQARIHRNNIMHIPKHLCKKVGAPCMWDDVVFLESVYPDLGVSYFLDDRSDYDAICELNTHISQVFHISHKVPLRIDDLIDGFLTSLLLVRYGIDDFLRHRMDPERSSVLIPNQHQELRPAKRSHRNVIKTVLADLLGQARLWLHV